MQLLPQKTQDGEAIFLLDDSFGICENGKILHIDALGKLYDTNFECVLEINQNTSPALIKANIIDLENILIGFCVVDLIHNKINAENFEFLNDDVVKFREFKINLETLEIAGAIQEFDLPFSFEPLSAETQEKIKAIVSAIYRENIDNFVDFEALKALFQSL